MLVNDMINPKRGLVDDIKYHNLGRESLIASEYYGAKYTYSQMYQMIEDYKRAFIAIDGNNSDSITIVAPSTVASVNAFYGATEANKIINLISPGFLNIKTEYYTKELGAKTLFIYEGFLTDGLISRLYTAGVKNIIITGIDDYMDPIIKQYATQSGLIKTEHFADKYVCEHKSLPTGMELLSINDFVSAGQQLTGDYHYKFKENQVISRFLTGATTSKLPKCVKLTADGFANMGAIYKQLWFDFQPKERLVVIIPLFYATGAIHGMHMGLLQNMTLVYKPKYDRFSFGKDLLESKANVALVAPSFVATLSESDLPNGALSHVKYLFIGGEAINPAQMRKFRNTAKRLGIHYILNGYGMTELGGMVGLSDKEFNDPGDVSVAPVPGSEYRIVNPETKVLLPDGERGLLHVKTPCASLGYFEEEKNKELFTDDGWINTGDIAAKDQNGHYRVFGRYTDYFTNGGKTYAMFDIEEKILELEEIAEAEVIKFTIAGEEYPAAVVVLKTSHNSHISETLKRIYSISVPGINYMLGVRFIEHFKISPVTSKRDYLSLSQVFDHYYSVDNDDQYYVTTIGQERIKINKESITVQND